jgi:hypothetical protein
VQFAGMALIVFAIFHLMLSFLLLRIFRLSTLEQLQGNRSRVVKQVSEINEAKPSYQSGLESSFSFLTLPALSSERKSNTRSDLRFIRRNIIRSLPKTILCILVTTSFVLVLGWLVTTINDAEQSLELLYENTVVSGMVTQQNLADIARDRYMGDVIWRNTVTQTRVSRMVQNVFVQGGHFRAYIIAPFGKGLPPETGLEIIGYNRRRSLPENANVLDFMFTFNDLELFMEHNAQEGAVGFTIEFISDFDPQNDFMYDLNQPIPIIVAESILERRGLELGDAVYLGYTKNSVFWFTHVPAVIVGVHNGQLAHRPAQNSFFLPLRAFEQLIGGLGLYITLAFEVDPAANHEILRVHHTLNNIVNRGNAGLVPLRLVWLDQTFFNVIGVANQTLLLLQLVYPVILVLSVVLAAGLNFILVQQNTQKAAVLRVLGRERKKTILLLFAEQTLVSMLGGLIGLAMLLPLGVYFNQVLFRSLLLYFLAFIVSTYQAAKMVTEEEPLQLLQVKE